MDLAGKACARCENADIECERPGVLLKKPATKLHTALSKSTRDSVSDAPAPSTTRKLTIYKQAAIKSMQKDLRTALEAKTLRKCEDNRDRVADMLSDKMGPVFSALARNNKLDGFQRGIDLAMETVKGCKGSCHCLLRGCTMGTKAAMFLFEEGEDEEESAPKSGKEKAPKAAKA